MGWGATFSHIFHGAVAAAPEAEAIAIAVDPALAAFVPIVNGAFGVVKKIESDHAADPGVSKKQFFVQEIESFLPMLVPIIENAAGKKIKNPDQFEIAIKGLPDVLKAIMNSFAAQHPATTAPAPAQPVAAAEPAHTL
jgi:hypothetical protein